MEISSPSKSKGLMNRSLSLAEFSPSKALNAQLLVQTFAQPTLIRHYSCEQIFSSPKIYRLQRSVMEEVKIFEPNESNMKDSESRNWSESAILEGTLKGDSIHKQEPTKIAGKSRGRKGKKVGIRPLVESNEMSKTDKTSCVFYILLPLTVLICGSIPFYFNSRPWAIPPDLRVCREVIPDVISLKEAFEKNVFGQQNAGNTFVELLRIFYTSRYPEVKVFAVAGGIGVGKSYMSSILSKYFPWKNNVAHLFWPVHHKEVSALELYKKLSICGVNLVIIDDIGIAEANNAIDLVKEVTEYSKQDHIRTVIVLVFNFLESQQDVSFEDIHDVKLCENHMEKIFKSMGLESEIICFENLEEVHIKKCIETAAHEKGLEWSSEKTNEILADLDSNTGCKVVNSKLQLLQS